MFVTNWNSTTKIQKISEITNFFRHYFLSRTEVFFIWLFRRKSVYLHRQNHRKSVIMLYRKIEKYIS